MQKTNVRKWRIRLIGLALGLAPPPLHATDNVTWFTYEGRLFDNSDNPLNSSSVDIKLQVYDPAANCLLLEETHNVDVSSTNANQQGLFYLKVGGGTATGNDPGLSMAQIFANAGTQIRAHDGTTCPGGYTPSVGDARRLHVSVFNGTAFEALNPDYSILSAPTAQVAETLSGKAASAFIQVNNGANATQSNFETLFSGGDASSLHTHDSLYAPLGGAAFTGNISTSGNLTVSGSVNVTGSMGLGQYNDGNEPTSGTAGLMWFNTTSNTVKVWNGSAAVAVGGSAPVTKVFNRTGNVVAQANDYTWSQIDKTTSSLNDIADKNATFLTGTLNDTVLSANVPLKDANNAFTNLNSFEYSSSSGTALALKSTSVSLANPVFAVKDSVDAVVAQIPSDGNALNAKDLTTKGYVDGVIGTAASSFLPLAGGAMGGALQLSMGSSGTPSLSFSTATDTGLYLGASNSIRFVNGGVESLAIDNAGNTGIGNLAPQTRLDVNGAIRSGIVTVASGATADMSLGNTVVFQSPGGGALTLNNLKPGGWYTILIEDTSSRTYTFGGCTTTNATPALGATVAGSPSIYHLVFTSGNICYVNWSSGPGVSPTLLTDGNSWSGTNTFSGSSSFTGIMYADSGITTSGGPLNLQPGGGQTTNLGSNSGAAAANIFSGSGGINLNSGAGSIGLTGPISASSTLDVDGSSAFGGGAGGLSPSGNYVVDVSGLGTISSAANSAALRVNTSTVTGIGNANTLTGVDSTTSRTFSTSSQSGAIIGGTFSSMISTSAGVTATSNSGLIGQTINIVGSGSIVNASYGVKGVSDVNSIGTVTNGYGVYGSAQTSSGNYTKAYGVYGAVDNKTANTIPDSYGVYGQIKNSSTGIITKGSSLYAAAPTNAGGTISNAYGLYVEDMSVASASTKYAIYVNGGNSYFGGTVGIGTPTPSGGASLELYSTSAVGTSMSLRTPGTGSNQQAMFNMKTSSANMWQFFANGNAYTGSSGSPNDFGLAYWDGSSWKDPIHIQATSGNVGIGSTAPAATMDVAGSIAVNSTYEGFSPYVNSGPAYTIPNTSANIVQVTLTSNATITLPSFTTPTNKVFSLMIFIKQDATGLRALTFAGNGSDVVKWDTGAMPPIATAAGKISIFQLIKPATESTWYGSLVWKEN